MPFKSALDQGVCEVAVHVPILRPDLGSEPDSPFARDAQNKLVRRSYWLHMNDPSLVIIMTNRIGAELINGEKRAEKTRSPI